VLYVSSLGSVSGSLATFVVDRRSGKLTPLGDPLPAGTAPRAVVAAPDGRFVYVADTDADRVLIFAVEAAGTLTARGAAPVDGDPFGMAMAPDGRALYATAQGTDRLVRFSVGRDGRLTRRASVPSGGTNPRGVAVSPDNRFVYVTNGLRDPAVPGTLAVFAVRRDGSLALLRSIVIGRFGAGITISPDGRLLFAESQATNQIRAYRRHGDGLLSELTGSPIASPGDPEGIVITPDARHLFVAATGQQPDGSPGGAGSPGDLQAFGLRADGTARPGTSVAAELLPNALAMTPDARFLYVSNSDSSDISAYSIGRRGGVNPIAGSPFGKGLLDGPGPQAMAILPDRGPTARFHASSPSSHAADPGADLDLIRFDATASLDPDGRVARYDWDFGDGTLLADGGPTPTHRYARPGAYTVTLTVIDDEGCSDHQIFTGQSALCNGSPTAAASRTVETR
jgi:DNA-binding beta-propeller fold protein YncE